MLRELFPSKVRIGELVDPANQCARLTRPDYERDFRALGFQPIFVGVAGAGDLERAIGETSPLGAEAFIVHGDPLFVAKNASTWDNRCPNGFGSGDAIKTFR